MADISYSQIVHDIKEKYIEATGEPDNIKFGEIAQDVYDAITSGGGGEQVIDTKTICTLTKLQSVVLAIPTNTTITIQ